MESVPDTTYQRGHTPISADLNRIRAALPALARGIYLNCGTSGPVPQPAADAMAEALQLELTGGRTGDAYFNRTIGLGEELRRLLAGMLGAGPEEMALTASTTEGINVAVWGLDWRAGDEVVTANTEHPGGLFPLFALRERHGVTIRVADLLHPGQDVVAALERLITPRTRLVVISHVSWCTGELYPIAEIAAMAHTHGVPVLVDGAQGAGATPLSLRASGVDFYALPGQKWLLGPEGTGALYVRADRLKQLRNTFAGFGSGDRWSWSKGFVPHPGASRYELSLRHPVTLAGQRAALAWLRDQVGLSWAVERIRTLAGRLRERLLAIPGVKVITPPQHAGLVAFRVPGMTPAAAVSALEEQGFWVRSLELTQAVRASCSFYNTEQEIDRLADQVAALAGHNG